MTKQSRNLGKSGAEDLATGDGEGPRGIRRDESADIDERCAGPLNLLPGVSFSVMFRLLLASRICRRRMAQFCRKNYDLEPNLFLILLAASEGHLQQGILAKTLGIDKNAMVFLIDNLELRRLIRRVPNPDNRRERLIECTVRGKQIAAEIKTNYPEIVRWGLYPLNDAQVEQFGALLTQIIEGRQDLPCPLVHRRKRSA